MSSVIVVVGALVFLGGFISLAYAAEDNQPLRYLVYAALAIADILGVLMWSAYSLVWAVQALSLEPVGGELMSEPLIQAVITIAPLLLSLSVLGLILLYPPFRRPLARLIPIDPQRVVHLVALHYALLLIGLSAIIAVTIAVLGADPATMEELSAAVGENAIAAAWGQALGLAVMALLGVGLFVHRSPRETLQRLGLTPFVSIRWWVAVPVLGLVSAKVLDQLWQAMDPAGLEEVSRISEALFEPFIAAGLVGALTVGLSAGIGEEMVFRGAAQTRFGLAATSFLFAILHTQYTVSPALIQVFVLAVLLGVARIRSNTTTAILGHATYNTILVLVAIYAPELSP